MQKPKLEKSFGSILGVGKRIFWKFNTEQFVTSIFMKTVFFFVSFLFVFVSAWHQAFCAKYNILSMFLKQRFQPKILITFLFTAPSSEPTSWFLATAQNFWERFSKPTATWRLIWTSPMTFFARDSNPRLLKESLRFCTPARRTLMPTISNCTKRWDRSWPLLR